MWAEGETTDRGVLQPVKKELFTNQQESNRWNNQQESNRWNNYQESNRWNNYQENNANSNR